MPLFYSSFDITTNGIITETKIPLSADGKRVHFNFYGGDLTKKLFMVINKELKAFDNNDKMETPVKGINRIYQLYPHEGNLIVIDTKPVKIDVDDIPVSEIPFTVGTKQSVILTVGSNISITFGVSDPEGLAVSYCEGGVSDPLNSVRDAVKSAYIKAKKEVLLSSVDRFRGDPTGFMGVIDNIAFEMEDCIKQYLMLDFPWIRMDSCLVNIKVLNSETIVSAVNEEYEITKTILMRFYDAICVSYNVPVFPPEMAQVLGAYVSANPGGVSTDQLERICNKLVTVSKRASPDEMLASVKKIGLLV